MAGAVSGRRMAVTSHHGSLESSTPESAIVPASDEDRHNWGGFCEIESEPAFFNTMLHDFGVEGVKVQEVVSLDEEMLAFLPRPVYGLIFLFRWTEEDPEKQEQSCPERIWFANQTSNNACASVALLNIVNNVPSIKLGNNLHAFKQFTADFSPALRGDAISNYDFVKDIHNSFARKMDMLNADLLLKHEATFRGKGKQAYGEDDDNVAGYHFVAFMPIEESLWKFDGLERQPMSLGPVRGDWLAQASPDIRARMAQYEENHIEFAILSLVKDPLIDLHAALASNVNSLIAIELQLNKSRPDWRTFTADDFDGSTVQHNPGYLTGPDAGLSLTQEHIASSLIAQGEDHQCKSESATAILRRRKELIAAQQSLRMAIQEELQSKHSEQDRASARTRDSGAKMQKFARNVQARRGA